MNEVEFYLSIKNILETGLAIDSMAYCAGFKSRKDDFIRKFINNEKSFNSWKKRERDKNKDWKSETEISKE